MGKDPIIQKDFQELNRLMFEIEAWTKENSNIAYDSTIVKKKRKSSNEKVATIELTNDNDLCADELEDMIAQCRDEFIKIRVIKKHFPEFVTKSMLRNDSPECRRRERPKTIVEYVL